MCRSACVPPRGQPRCYHLPVQSEQQQLLEALLKLHDAPEMVLLQLFCQDCPQRVGSACLAPHAGANPPASHTPARDRPARLRPPPNAPPTPPPPPPSLSLQAQVELMSRDLLAGLSEVQALIQQLPEGGGSEAEEVAQASGAPGLLPRRAVCARSLFRFLPAWQPPQMGWQRGKDDRLLHATSLVSCGLDSSVPVSTLLTPQTFKLLSPTGSGAAAAERQRGCGTAG